MNHHSKKLAILDDSDLHEFIVGSQQFILDSIQLNRIRRSKS